MVVGFHYVLLLWQHAGINGVVNERRLRSLSHLHKQALGKAWFRFNVNRSATFLTALVVLRSASEGLWSPQQFVWKFEKNAKTQLAIF